MTVENLAGANGVIGIAQLAKAEPDGYTIGVVVASHAMARALVPNLPYDPVADFTPITTTALTDMVLVVPPKLEANNVKEFVALAKEKPGTLAYKSAGQGSNSHLFAAWFADAAGLDLIHIPYKGSGDSMPDLMAGVTQMGFDTLPAVRGYLENGQLKAIAAGGPKRSTAYPDLPTVSEQGVDGFAANSWGMVLGPKGIPDHIVKYLNDNIVKVLQMPEVKENSLPRAPKLWQTLRRRPKKCWRKRRRNTPRSSRSSASRSPSKGTDGPGDSSGVATNRNRLRCVGLPPMNVP